MTSVNRTEKTHVRNEPEELEEDELRPRGVECKVCKRDRWRIAYLPPKVEGEPAHLAIQCCNKSCGPPDFVPVAPMGEIGIRVEDLAPKCADHKYFRLAVQDDGVVRRVLGACCCHKRPMFDVQLLPKAAFW